MVKDCVTIGSWHHLVHDEGHVFCNKCGREWHLGNIYAREDDGSEWVSLETYPPRAEKKWEPPPVPVESG